MNPESGEMGVSLSELADLYDHAPCGYLSLAPDAHIERVNATFLAWTGHAESDLVGRPFQSLLTLPGKIYFETHFAPLLRLQGFFHEVALDLTGRDGQKIPVLVNAMERHRADGGVRSIRMTVFNATDRRRYERDLLTARNELTAANRDLRAANDLLAQTNQQLDRTNSELHALYDTLPVGIFRSDPTGMIVQSSQRFCKMLGVTLAKDWANAIAAEDRAEVMSHWMTAVTNRVAFTHRFDLQDDATGQRYLDMKAVPIVTAAGEAALTGVLSDVTDEVRGEAQMRQIERLAAARQLTGGMAHNLNNILTVIMGNLEGLEDDLSDRPDRQRALDTSLKATERAAALVSRLLVYAGYSSIARSGSIAVDSALRGIAADLTGHNGRTHPIVLDLQAPDAVIDLDRAMLADAVRELVLNAAGAQPAGGAIRLSTRVITANGPPDHPVVIVSVEDQGVGMDKATLAKARDPFFTLHEVGRGVGLGLSLVDGVCRIAGGELRLTSLPGKGTTAEMHIPVLP